jgi:predicted DNA-binding antitoxin AbrB/MazE fold protein
MTITVQAVYAGGVLRPIQPLALEEGETVEVTVASAKPVDQRKNDDDITRRLKTASSITEWVAATKFLPADDGGYDILRALNENRILSGERPLIPDGGTPP